MRNENSQAWRKAPVKPIRTKSKRNGDCIPLPKLEKNLKVNLGWRNKFNDGIDINGTGTASTMKRQVSKNLNKK